MDNENTNIDKKEHILIVNAPTGTILRINGELTNEIIVEENQPIEITCSKTGYVTYTKVIDSLTDDLTIDIKPLELLKHTVKIITEDTNKVTINSEETIELVVDEFTPVNIVVSANGYISEYQTIEKITEDTEINIVLNKIYHTFKIFIPEESEIEFTPELLAKEVEDSDGKYLLVTVDEFTPVHWLITKTGYKDHYVFIDNVLSDTNYDAPILQYETFSITVNPGKNCNGAKLTFNDEHAVFGQVTEIGTVGSEVTVKVEKEHYVTYLETVTLTENTVITVDLEERYYTVSVENIPNGTEVLYYVVNNADGSNGKQQYYTEPINIQSGSKLVIKASKQDYKPFIYTIDSVSKDYAIRIPEMELQNFNLTVNAPEGSIIKVNGTETKYFPQIFDIHSIIKIEVSKDNYVTHTHEFEILEDTVYDCILNLEQYRLTVTSNPDDATISIINGSEQYFVREMMLDYGSEVIIRGNLDGYELIEKKVQILRDTTENLVFEKRKVELSIVAEPMSVLNEALIKINGVQIEGTETKVLYGEPCEILVDKFGYRPFKTIITPYENTIVRVNGNGIWNKPALSVTVINAQELNVVPIILINNLPVGNGVSIPINYDSYADIEINAVDCFTITDRLHIMDDFTAQYELVNINSGKYYLSVSTDLENAQIFINGIQRSKGYFEPDSEITIEIKHEGYETISETFILTENIEKYYPKENFTKKIFTCRWYTNPSMAIVKVDGETIDKKVIEIPYMTELEYDVLCEKYLPESGRCVIKNNTKISVTLNQDPSYVPDEDEDIYGDGIDGIIRMIKIKACYTYLNIGRYFNDGINEETVHKFYKEFGYYVSSRFDYLLWRKMHDYFGHDDTIQEPEPDQNKSTDIVGGVEIES